MENTPFQVDFDRLMLIVQGHAAFQLLWAGATLNLFTLLSQDPGQTREQLQQQLSLAPQPASILLTGLTAIGLIRKETDRYFNSGVAEHYLVATKADTLVPVLGWQHHIVYPGLHTFADSLRANANLGLECFPGPGTTLYERLTAHPEIEQVFQAAMSALSKQANAALIERIDLTSVTHLVDVGGGDGTNAIAIAQANQRLHVTVFDSASVCQIAEQNIIAAGLGGRVRTHPGNLLSDPFPAGADALLFSHMFTIWSADRNRVILRKSFDSLPIGGQVFIFNMMGNDDATGPVSTALGSPYFLAIATGEGMLYSWADYQRWMSEVGFWSFYRVDGLPFDHGLFVGKK